MRFWHFNGVVIEGDYRMACINPSTQGPKGERATTRQALCAFDQIRRVSRAALKGIRDRGRQRLCEELSPTSIGKFRAVFSCDNQLSHPTDRSLNSVEMHA